MTGISWQWFLQAGVMNGASEQKKTLVRWLKINSGLQCCIMTLNYTMSLSKKKEKTKREQIN